MNRTQAGALPMRRSTTKLSRLKTWETLRNLTAIERSTYVQKLGASSWNRTKVPALRGPSRPTRPTMLKTQSATVTTIRGISWTCGMHFPLIRCRAARRCASGQYLKTWSDQWESNPLLNVGNVSDCQYPMAA